MKKNIYVLTAFSTIIIILIPLILIDPCPLFPQKVHSSHRAILLNPEVYVDSEPVSYLYSGEIHYAWDNNPCIVPQTITYAYLDFRLNYFSTHFHTKDSLDHIIKLADKNLTTNEAGIIKSKIFTEF
jgi:hypothetical protein